MMKTVNKYDDAVEAIKRWNAELPRSPRLAQRLATFQHFYFAPALDLVGPSKFIGYQGLTARRYLDLARSELWGGATERVLSRWFEELMPGTPEDAVIRSKVEALCSRFGKWPRRGSKMHAPKGWSGMRRSRAGDRRAGNQGAMAVRETGPGLRKTITAAAYRSDNAFVAECVEIPVVTQGRDLEETLRNLQEAVALHLEDEDLSALGLVASPSIVVTMELEPALA